MLLRLISQARSAQSAQSARIFATAAALSIAISLPLSVRASAQTTDTPESRMAYTQKIAKDYTYRYGVDHPFLPSNMNSDTGQFIDPKSFATAQYCGHCHQEAHAEWRQSAHSNSNRAPWYIRNVNLLNAEKGISFSRHCEGCHDPIAVVAGAITEGAPRKRP